MSRKLQFLSRSVLLEESGLPKMNRVTILSVFLILVLFGFWASEMTINDSVSIDGEIVQIQSDAGYYIDAKVYSGDLGSISEGMPALIHIAGITERKKIDAVVDRIVKVPQKDNYSRTYYEVRVYPVIIEGDKSVSKAKVVRGMDASVEVITGTRNLLQYYFSRLWDARNVSG